MQLGAGSSSFRLRECADCDGFDGRSLLELQLELDSSGRGGGARPSSTTVGRCGVTAVSDGGARRGFDGGGDGDLVVLA